MKKDRFPCTDEQSWLDQQNWKAMELYKQLEMEMIMSYHNKSKKPRFNNPINHDPMFGDVNRNK